MDRRIRTPPCRTGRPPYTLPLARRALESLIQRRDNVHRWCLVGGITGTLTKGSEFPSLTRRLAHRGAIAKGTAPVGVACVARFGARTIWHQDCMQVGLRVAARSVRLDVRQRHRGPSFGSPETAPKRGQPRANRSSTRSSNLSFDSSSRYPAR